MEEIIFDDFLKIKLNNLIRVLFDKEYFGYAEDAKNYVDSIIEFIYTIPEQIRHRSKNNRHGAYYVRFKVKNKRTIYYVTFDVKDKRYIVKNFFTNHEREYPIYIRGKK